MNGTEERDGFCVQIRGGACTVTAGKIRRVEGCVARLCRRV